MQNLRCCSTLWSCFEHGVATINTLLYPTKDRAVRVMPAMAELRLTLPSSNTAQHALVHAVLVYLEDVVHIPFELLRGIIRSSHPLLPLSVAARARSSCKFLWRDSGGPMGPPYFVGNSSSIAKNILNIAVQWQFSC